MENKKFNVNINISFILFIIFLILKLDGIIDWQWIWIFSPIWIMWIIKACVCIVVAIVSFAIKQKYKPHFASGNRLVWDAKTNTLYGPCTAEDNETV